MKKIFNNFYKLSSLCLMFAMVGLTLGLNAQTFPGTGGLPIPPTGTGGFGTAPTVSNATVSGITGDVVGITVEVELTHTWASDLEMFLDAPNGATIELTTDNGSLCGTDPDPTTLVFNDNFPNSPTNWPCGNNFFEFRPENGMLMPPAVAQPNGTWTLRVGDDAGGDTGTLYAWSITLDVASCEIVCPMDVTASTDPGVCEALVTVPDPELIGTDCEILGVAGNFQTATGPLTDLQYSGGDLIDSPFDIPGVSQVPASATCVTEVCIDVTVTGDFGFATENAPILLEGVQIGNVLIQAGDCQTSTTTVCVPVADYNAAAADGVLNMAIGADPDVDSFCAQETVEGSVTYPTACVDFLNSFTGAANGPAVYPLGETCFTITGTGSGGGMSFPISCDVCVTVEDNEAPVLDCPSDFTFNLQGGECEQIYDYEITVTDNCPVGEIELPGTTFGSIGNCPGSGFTLACPINLTSQVQEIDISGFPATAPVRIDEGCFMFDNAAWGISEGLINFYIAPAGAQAAQTPPPCYETATPVATSGLVDLSGFANQTEVCLPVFDMNGDPFLIQPGTPGLYMEARALTTGSFTFNGQECNGIVADGTNTFLCSTNCGDGWFAQFGFTDRDAFFSFTGEVVPPEPPMAPGLNEFESGDALPIGTHCFEFSAVDFAGNLSSCDWCVTVNEFPEDQIVTSLACNDLVNVSLNEDCSAFISADMFLEGGPYGCYFNCYEVYIEGIAGDVNGQTLELEPGTYTVTVNDACRDNSCWGEMVVEDKLPPMMPPIEDL